MDETATGQPSAPTSTNTPSPQSPQLEDGPPRIEYVVARHVAILDEHEMASGPSGTPMYCGPKELQQIADNNNKRVETTGDATPIVIGHTVDGKDENKQPEIVGYATNFSVGPLFNSGRTALFADFHIRKDKVEEANKYPRRSVELWPKRWEIDPISLLGATTPERDLGLLQLHRQGSPVRYSRMSPKDESDNSRSQTMADVPMKKAEGGGPGEAPDDGTAKIVAAVLESAPIKQMLEQQQELMMMLQGGGAPQHGEPDGDEGGAPPPPMPQGQGAPEEGAAPGGEGGPGEQDAAWIHEGAPERYEEDEDGYFDPSCGNMGKKKYSGFASASNDYVPTTGPSRMSRRTQHTPTYQEYLAQLEQGDRQVRMSRDEQRLNAAERRIKELEQDKIRYSRGEKLRTLQAEGLDIDVADEIKHIEELGMTEDQFAKYLDRIKVKYQRDPSRVEAIRVAASEGSAAITSPVSRLSNEQKNHYARAVAERVIQLRSTMGEKEAFAQAHKELAPTIEQVR